MKLCEPGPVVVAADSNASPQEACEVFFYGYKDADGRQVP